MSEPTRAFPYPCFITLIPKSDGGGFFVEFPDFEDVNARGATWEEMIENGNEALDFHFMAKDMIECLPELDSPKMYDDEDIDK